MFEYQIKNSYETRRKECEKLLKKYPGRVPVIVKKADNSTTTPDIDKEKYLVPRYLSVGQFLYIIRKRIKLTPDQAVFLFCDNKNPGMNTIFETLYEEHAKQDGFLYVVYSLESTFG